MAEHNEAESSTSHTTLPPVYEPRPSLRYASIVGLQAAGVGAFVSAIQNALGKHNRGAAGFFTRTGGTIGFFGAFLYPTYFLTFTHTAIFSLQVLWEQYLL